MSGRTITIAAVLCTAIAAPAAAAERASPGRPIRLVVPTAPGGGNDTMARIVAQRLAERLGQGVIVDNKAGGNGTIGADTVAKAPADGQTLLFGYIATHGINPALSRLPYDAVRDFAPITRIADAQGVLVVHPGLAAKSVADLVALGKSGPGTLSYASAGNGTAPHIAGELFKQLTGTDFVHVPYKGSAPALVDTLGGHTRFMFPSLVAASQHIRSGRLRALAVTGAVRSTAFPALPTVAESGVAGFEITQWYAFFAPARTPREVVTRLHGEIVAIAGEPAIRAKFAEQGADIVTSTPEALGAFVSAEIQRWGKVIRTAGIRAD